MVVVHHLYHPRLLGFYLCVVVPTVARRSCLFTCSGPYCCDAAIHTSLYAISHLSFIILFLQPKPNRSDTLEYVPAVEYTLREHKDRTRTNCINIQTLEKHN